MTLYAICGLLFMDGNLNDIQSRVDIIIDEQMFI